MSDRKNILTVDLGDVLHSELLAVSEASGKSKSQLTREALSTFLDNCNTGSVGRVTSKTIKHKKPGRVEITKIIQVYNDTFYTGKEPPRHYWGPIIGVVNAARKNGLTIAEICELIRVAPEDPFVDEKFRAGSPLTIPELLSAKMIDRLFKAYSKAEEKQVTLSANDFVEYKYDMLDKHFPRVSPDYADDFRDALMACETEKQVKALLKDYALS